VQRLGAALQLLGLTVTGFALLHGVVSTDQRAAYRELGILGVGIVVFFLGWLAAKRGQWQS
jgi:hypothetical protein